VEKSDVATGISARRDEPPAVAEPGTPTPRLDPVMAQKYWLSIILWAIAFVLMIFYEAIAALFSR
jgi:hypothetical protein